MKACLSCLHVPESILPSTEAMLSGFQAHDKEIEEDMDGYLLESWPDDPGEAGLGSALKGLGFLFAPAKYPDGAWLACQGDSIDSIFYIEEGVVEVTYPEQLDSDLQSDDEEARSVVSSNSKHRKRSTGCAH